MRTRIVLGLTVLAVLGLFTTASAAPRVSPSISFFSTTDSQATWVKVAGDQQLQFAASAIGFAGVELKHTAPVAPLQAPTFAFSADQDTASGGSPRLVMSFSDGGRMEARPLSWTQAEQTVGSGSDWDNNGGTCGYRYGTTYAAALACHAGATVTSVRLVTDSGWLNGDHTLWIDDIQYGGVTLGAASGNGNG